MVTISIEEAKFLEVLLTDGTYVKLSELFEQVWDAATLQANSQALQHAKGEAARDVLNWIADDFRRASKNPVISESSRSMMAGLSEWARQQSDHADPGPKPEAPANPYRQG